MKPPVGGAEGGAAGEEAGESTFGFLRGEGGTTAAWGRVILDTGFLSGDMGVRLAGEDG